MSWLADIFDEDPSTQRRLVLLLYILVGIPFSIVFILVGGFSIWREAISIVALISVGFVWMIVRTSPKTYDWIFPVSFVPAVCCAIAANSLGEKGIGYTFITMAPMVWASALFTRRVAQIAWLVAQICFIYIFGLEQFLSTNGIANLLLVGNISGFVSWVTFGAAERQRKMRRELEKAVYSAEAASRAKSNFLANMSHEIRTPLNGVIGMTEIVLDSNLTKDQRNNLEIVRYSGEHLLSILNDILDLSKIEAGKMSIENKVFSMPKLLEGVVSLFRARADEKGIQLNLEIDKSLGQNYIGDIIRIRQVLANLIGNAIKFTEIGEVTLSVFPNANKIFFSVRDTGKGINPERLDLIFSPFTQEDESTTRIHGGTGLGLTITKQLVEIMGGKLSVSSVLNQGSTFQFYLPLLESDSLPEDEERLGKLRSSNLKMRSPQILKILIVEDSEINLIIVKRMITDLGHEVYYANNGKKAVSMIQNFNFDLVFMDWSMPEMDGIEATRVIRSQEASENKKRIPIIALTANAMQENIDACLAAGMDDFLSKPVSKAKILAILERCINELPKK